MQTAEQLRSQLLLIRDATNNLRTEKKSNDEIIKSLEQAIDNAIEEDDDALNIRQTYREKKHKLQYRKVLNSKIKLSEKALDECIEGVGDFDKDQLSLFTIDEAKKEYEEKLIASESDKPDESEEETDPDPFGENE
jgi:hypothetical protein